MIIGRVADGQIRLSSVLPEEWEGQAVRIEPCAATDVAPDLAQRLTALHALGPMEHEPGERQQIEQALAAMNELSRNQIQQIADAQP